MIRFVGGPADGFDSTSDPMRAAVLAQFHRYPHAVVLTHRDDGTVCVFSYYWTEALIPNEGE